MAGVYKLLLGALAAFVFLMLANAFLFGLVFPDGPPEHYENERVEPKPTFNMMGLAITALLLSYMFPKGYAGGVSWAEGLRFGMLAGVLVSVPMSLHIHAVVAGSFAVHLTVIFWSVLTWGASGALIGGIHGKGARTN